MQHIPIEKHVLARRTPPNMTSTPSRTRHSDLHPPFTCLPPAPMDLLLELEPDWAALDPLGPDDATLLRSVRSLLDEMDALPDPESPPETPVPQLLPLAPLLLPAPAGPPLLLEQATAAKRKRRRPQDEADALRRQVYELTVQLDALRFQEAHGARVDPAVLRSTPPSSWRLLQTERPPWRTVAADQREARRSAELENLWLRALVQSTSAKAQQARDAFERHIVAAVRAAACVSTGMRQH